MFKELVSELTGKIDPVAKLLQDKMPRNPCADMAVIKLQECAWWAIKALDHEEASVQTKEQKQ